MTHVEDTWASRELPILIAAYALVESGASHSVEQLEGLRQELGMPAPAFELGLDALANADPPYIELVLAGGWSSEKAGGGFITGVTERARRELGAWPTPESLADQLVAALLAAADREEDPTRAEKLREAAGNLGSSAVKGVLVSLFTRMVVGITE